MSKKLAVIDEDVMKKAVELAFAAKAVVHELSRKDRTPEGLLAAEMVDEAINSIFLNQPKLVAATGG